MKVLESLSRNIARTLKKNNPDSEVDIEVLEYGIAMTINQYGVILITITIGAIFGQIMESVLAFVGLATIRSFSGGIHFSSLTVCMIMTSLFCVIVSVIPLSKTAVVIVTMISMLIFLLRAPNWFEEIAVHKNGTIYKCLAVFIVSINLVVQSTILAIVFFVQALTILPKGGVKDEKKD